MSDDASHSSTDPAATPAANELRKANRKLTWQLTAFAMGSLAFGFALVPLYDVLCEVTGYGNRKTLLEASDVVANTAPSREVTVEFLATNPTVGEWEFKPVAGSMKVLTGQLVEAKFTAKNLLAQPATGQAIPDIAPSYATGYFRKTECFCFTPQHFKAGEEREFVVRFLVDTQLPGELDRITLGYSMYGVTQRVASR
jgi:cytochrome c oxidase assembly protein subunit 11